jgi:TetR/AcrR family transcriptional repressor for divergent bdcA
VKKYHNTFSDRYINFKPWTCIESTCSGRYTRVIIDEVTMNEKARQRRPAFDREAGVAIAQSMFHQRGFDAVSLTDLVDAMDIKPPSFYAAYGSKAELFERAMLRYASENALPLDKLLAPERPPGEALAALLIAAAKQYGRDSILRGCMITEGLRADDPAARGMAEVLSNGGLKAIRAYLDQAHPQQAQAMTDYISVTLRGMSAAACNGMPRKRLLEVAQTAGRFLAHELASRTGNA